MTSGFDFFSRTLSGKVPTTKKCVGTAVQLNHSDGGLAETKNTRNTTREQKNTQGTENLMGPSHIPVTWGFHPTQCGKRNNKHPLVAYIHNPFLSNNQDY